MTFVKGMPRPANAGRKKGSPKSQTKADIRAALALHGIAIAHELVRLALSAKREETRVAAAREVFDRVLGKATQPIEGQMLFGVSAELQRLLAQHDGNSRSIPTPLIEHDAEIANGDNGNSFADMVAVADNLGIRDVAIGVSEGEGNRLSSLTNLDAQNGDLQHDGSTTGGYQLEQNASENEEMSSVELDSVRTGPPDDVD